MRQVERMVRSRGTAALPQVLNQISENSQLAGATSKQKSNLGEMRTETTARSVEQQEDKAAKGLPAMNRTNF